MPRRTAGAPEHPAVPARWFTAYAALSPSRMASVADGLAVDRKPGRARNLHQLDTSNGCQDHAVLPSAASSRHTLQPARMLPEEVSTEAFKRRSSCASSPLTEEPPSEHT